eukprot:873315-Pyramimonas_sp.AAC.1
MRAIVCAAEDVLQTHVCDNAPRTDRSSDWQGNFLVCSSDPRIVNRLLDRKPLQPLVIRDDRELVIASSFNLKSNPHLVVRDHGERALEALRAELHV